MNYREHTRNKYFKCYKQNEDLQELLAKSEKSEEANKCEIKKYENSCSVLQKKVEVLEREVSTY